MAFLVFHSDRTIYRDAEFHQEINKKINLVSILSKPLAKLTLH